MAVRRQDLTGPVAVEPNAGVSLRWQPDVVADVPTPPAHGISGRPPTGHVEDLASPTAGAVLTVLGEGADGLHRDATDAYPLDLDEALDIVGLDPRCPTTFVAQEGGVRLEAVGAAGAVYAKITGPCLLAHGDAFVIGMTVMRYEAAARRPDNRAWGSLTRLREDGWPLERYDVTGLGATIGRSRGDVVLTHDPFLSLQHCRIVTDATGVYLDDLRSGNGTFRAVAAGEVLAFGTIVRLGNATLRVDPVSQG